MSFVHSLKPGVSKRYLLFIAALAWTFAGGMLLYRGFTLLLNFRNVIWPKVLISTAGGILFYLFMFSGISLKHIKRIMNLKSDFPCLFSFFNIKSYVLMGVMITSGVLLRKSGLVEPQYISVIYITMGIPLLLSSVRFYFSGYFYNKR